MLDGHQHLVAHVGKGLHEVPVQVLGHMEAVKRDPGVGECRRRYQAMELVKQYLKSKKDFQSYFESDWDLEFSAEIEIKYLHSGSTC